MQNDKICSDIVNSLGRTKTEVNLLLDEVDVLSAAIYRKGEDDFTGTMEKKIRAKTAYALSQIVTETNREEVLAGLKTKLTSRTFLGLTLAFEPTLEIIGRLSAWAKQNLGEDVTLDITINKSILGGCNIEYKGKIANFTLLKEINSYLSNTKW